LGKVLLALRQTLNVSLYSPEKWQIKVGHIHAMPNALSMKRTDKSKVKEAVSREGLAQKLVGQVQTTSLSFSFHLSQLTMSHVLT
jgi:hypothetical protein